MEDPNVSVAAEEISDALVRATLRDQARAMGRIRLPKRGCTKAPLKGSGRFAVRSRSNLHVARVLRAQRKRWLRGDFTESEIEDTRQMLETIHSLINTGE